VLIAQLPHQILDRTTLLGKPPHLSRLVGRLVLIAQMPHQILDKTTLLGKPPHLSRLVGRLVLIPQMPRQILAQQHNPTAGTSPPAVSGQLLLLLLLLRLLLLRSQGTSRRPLIAADDTRWQRPILRRLTVVVIDILAGCWWRHMAHSGEGGKQGSVRVLLLGCRICRPLLVGGLMVLRRCRKSQWSAPVAVPTSATKRSRL
jgi:hypothetical protein